MINEKYENNREYKPFGTTELALDSIPSLACMRFGLSIPANRIAEMLKDSGLGGCRQSVINWLQNGGTQLSLLLPSLKERLLSLGANVNILEIFCN